MASYYYAAAALPMLSLSEKPMIESGDFLDFCKEQMSATDFQLLRSCRLDAESDNRSDVRDNEISYAWYRWEKCLRNELVKLRADKLGKEPGDYLRESGEILGMEEISKQAFSAENPLESERRLYEARWNYLEELGTNIFFTLESLIVYYLKLQLLEKLGRFEEEQGEENFNEIYSRIRDNADRDTHNENESNIGVNP